MSFSFKSNNERFNKHKMKPRDRRDTRLVKEYNAIDELCSKTSKINYEVVTTNKRGIPERYKISYNNIKSITGINSEFDKSPIYGFNHDAVLNFPIDFPGTSHPEIFMTSDIWHPNIKSKDPKKGRICINAKQISKYHGVEDLIYRVGELLQYKNYWAIWEPPYPEDEEVAEWVISYAEPNNIVNREKGIVIDETDIMESDDLPDVTENSIHLNEVQHKNDNTDDEDDDIEIIFSDEDSNPNTSFDDDQDDEIIIEI
jgi:ubiquitin-protein ligase